VALRPWRGAMSDRSFRGCNDFRNSLVKSMTKSELIEILSARHSQLAPKDAELAVKTMLDAMSQTLAQGDRIEIRGFGSFGLNYRPPRTGRNPKTGEKVQVPKKYVPHFKAGKELRERVDLIDAPADMAGTKAAADGE
jgi:integration host factor subunit beta